MEDKVLMFMGAAAGVTVAGRGVRPVAKLAMRGVIAAADATVGARQGLVDLYAEAKAEQRGVQTATEAASAPRTST